MTRTADEAMETGNETGKPRVAIRNPALVTRVLELRQAGRTISQIARELQLSRPSVRKYIGTAGEIATSFQEQIDAITQAALESIRAQILDRNARGDGRLALDFAKCTVFAEKQGPTHLHIDARVQQAFQQLPAAQVAAAPSRINGASSLESAPAPHVGRRLRVPSATPRCPAEYSDPAR